MAVPWLGGLDSAAFNENTVNATPRVIDSDVSFLDEDGDFDGGNLTVSGLLAEDRISLASDARVYLSGSAVWFDADGAGGVAAVLIGAASGGVGADFTVTFNAAATSAAVEAVIEHLTYANVSDTPTASRGLTFAIMDAAGNALGDEPHFVQRTGAQNPFDGLVSNIEELPTSPVFVDLDGDGDLDVAIGEYNGGLYSYGPSYFENIGTATNPSFVLVTGADEPFDGLPGINFQNLTFGDLDGDGDLDAVTGSIDRQIYYLRNTGSPTDPSFVVVAGAEDPFADPAFQEVSSFGRPTLVDLDGDGDLDLYVGGQYVGGEGYAGGIGEYAGIIYFENVGTATAPVFSRNDAENPFADDTFEYDDHTSVKFADWDNDGDLDAWLTIRSRATYFYDNIGTATNPILVGRPWPEDPLRSLEGGEISVGDLDGDGDLDVIIGGTGGNVHYLENLADAAPTLTISVFAEGEPITGTSGADNLAGTPDGETIDGLGGADVLQGWEGDDTLYGRSGDDELSGNLGEDVLEGGDGSDFLDGGDQDDLLVGGTGHDYLRGGAGADVMRGGVGNDTYVVDDAGDVTDETGGGGVDLVRSTISWVLATGIDNLILGSPAGHASGTGNALNNELTGNIYSNILTGLGGNDRLFGLMGADTLYGDAGADVLDGGLGADLLEGGAGADDLVGGEGGDTLRGGTHADDLSGGEGNDHLDGGAGGDLMTGGQGDDTYVVDAWGDVLVELAGQGGDTIILGFAVSWTLAEHFEGLTLMAGTRNLDGTGNDAHNLVRGNDGANVLLGLVGNDVLEGLGGDDRLEGGVGYDTLRGGDGADRLFGGADIDALYGGAGNDHLFDDQNWSTVLDGGDGDDVLTGLGAFVGGAGHDRFTVIDYAPQPYVRTPGLLPPTLSFDVDFANGEVIDVSRIDFDSVTPGRQSATLILFFDGTPGQMIIRRPGLYIDVNGDRAPDLILAVPDSAKYATANLYTGPGDTDGGWIW